MPQKSLLKDQFYKKGFGIRGMGADDNDWGVKREAKFGQDEKPVWSLAQWGAKYNMADETEGKITEIKDGVYTLETVTNKLICDTNEKSLVFTCLTSKCYDAPRTGSEPWQHLLVETDFTGIDTPEDFAIINKIKALNVSGEIQLLNFEDHLGDAFDGGVHAAQFLMYITLHNFNKQSKGYCEMVWFGIPFFDNRHEWIDYSAMLDKGTNCLMVSIGNSPVFTGGKSFFDEGKIVFGEHTPSYKFEINVLPAIINAHKVAQEEGYFLNTNLEDLCVTGMNLGWEIPGTYDVSMMLKDFEVISEF